MPYALSRPGGALSSSNITASDKRKLLAALSNSTRVNQAASGQGFGSAPPSVGEVRQNPGIAVGPAEDSSGYAKSFAKQALMSMAQPGFGPLSAVRMGYNAIADPSTYTDTQLHTVPGLPNAIAFNPGPVGVLGDMAGFGGLMRVGGALNRANLERIARTDPNASMVGGPGWGGAFSHGTFSGTLPGGLEAATRRAMVHNIAQQHYANRDKRDRDRRDLGRNSAGVRDAGRSEANSNAG
jgi:hypothetical protein